MTALYESVAPLRNVSGLMTLIERVQNRAFGLPGMATFYGPSGFGKSTAATYAMNFFGACYIEVGPLWRSKQLLAAIAHELTLKPARTAADIFEQVAEQLGRNQRPLLIDEADRLIRDDMIEVVRGLYEASNVPVVLIGEEELPMKIMKWERVHGRMLDWVAAQPAEMADVTQLAAIYAAGVEIRDDLKARLLKESGGSLRRVSTNLSHVKETALTLGLSRMGVSEWGTRAFFRGEAPPPRREHSVERSRHLQAARTARRA
jgi:DNA transposition AAA+ family ATPase